MKQNRVHGLAINDERKLKRALIDLIPDPGAIIGAALSDASRSRLRSNTEDAHARGIFGARTMFVGDEMFRDSDRLNDAIAFAARISASASAA